MNEIKFFNYFDKIYIINLASRADRRKEIEAQLEKINLSLHHPKVILYNAIKPLEAGEFPSIGARGCFLSHFGILQDAKNQKYQRILIFEDDLDLNKDFIEKSDLVLSELLTNDWHIFYGDHRIENLSEVNIKPLKIVNSGLVIGTTNFIGFNGLVIDALVNYFEMMLTRSGGDPLGGPMHVDGAYTWFRKQHKDFITAIATPQLGYQRSSASDIADLRWIEKIPFIHIIRIIKKKIKSL